jgi:polyisoprenoid-binding protein YceI
MSIERWEIDSRTSGISFAVRHLMISKVRGRFSRWSGSIQVPDGAWDRAVVDVVIDALSIETGIAARDAHLRSADYLDVHRHPDITFRTRSVRAAPSGGWWMTGDLTLRGHRHEVSLRIEPSELRRDSWGNDRMAFSARTTVDRRDFGLTGNLALDSGGIVIGTYIEIEIQVEAVRQPAARAA